MLMFRKKADRISIEALRLQCRIGVFPEERETPQRIDADIVLHVEPRFEDMDDNLAATVDYDALARRIRELAENRERKLIETLAADIIATILTDQKISEAEVKLKKYVLPDTGHVGVEMRRKRKQP